MAYDQVRIQTIINDLEETPKVLAAIVDLLQNPPSGGAGDASASNQVLEITALNAINASTDTLEALIASTNTKLDTVHTDLGTIDGRVDGLETLITSTNTKLDTVHTDLTTLDGHVDGLEGQVGIVTETAPGTDTASSGLNGRLQRIAQRLTSLIALHPAALGQTTKSGSLAVVLASDDDIQAKLGIVTETAPGTDTASSGLNGRLQRVAQRLTSLIALFPTAIGRTTSAGSLSTVVASDDAMIGIVTETAPASDTASSGLNGRLQRIAQRLTTLITAVGTQVYGAGTSAAAQRTTTASDSPEIALFGAVTETAPGTDTASSGLNGRLQRIAQRLTSLIALFPTAIGRTTSAGSLSIVTASDDALIGIVTETAPASDTASSGLNGRLQRIAQRLTSLLTQGVGLATGALRVVGADDDGPTTTSRLLSCAATTNATSVKGSAGTLFGVKGVNTAVANKVIKFYNKATAPTVGTDTPVMTIILPANSIGGGFFEYSWPKGRYFATGIAYALTGAVADADTTALTAADIQALNVDYR